MPGTLSERIAALRKERGLTQEQLGKMVGVSSQAVGKWERGGAPDVELLPVLAGQLGVTIDALFGLESGARVDIKDVLGGWLQGFPAGERMGQFCRLVWSSLRYFLPGMLMFPEQSYADTCKSNSEDSGAPLMLIQGHEEGGFLVDIHAEDFSFVTLWPRPKGGYAQWLAPKSEYRRLFEVLAKPGCLELLGFLYSRKLSYISPAAAAKQLDLPQETVAELLALLAEREILYSMELELAEGEVTAYKVAEPLAFLPFLYLARCLMQSGFNHLEVGDAVQLLGPEEIWKDRKEK